MSRTVYIETEECLACESCTELCPEVFAMDESTGKAKVIMPEGGSEDCIDEAMGACPAECIHWRG
jgi:ferredoxin